MTTLPVPCGPLAVKSDLRKTAVGRRGASAAVIRVLFGRALRSDHADTFDMNATGVPTDSAAVVCAGAFASARVGRLAAPTRG